MPPLSPLIVNVQSWPWTRKLLKNNPRFSNVAIKTRNLVNNSVLLVSWDRVLRVIQDLSETTRSYPKGTRTLKHPDLFQTDQDSQICLRVLVGMFKGSSTLRIASNGLRQILCNPKDPVPAHQQEGVVYKISCSDCSKSYIGQTGRTLAQRVKEHQRYVRTFDVNNSALAEQ